MTGHISFLKFSRAIIWYHGDNISDYKNNLKNRILFFCYFLFLLCHTQSQSLRQSSRLRGPVGQELIRGGQSMKLSTKAAVLKRVSLLIGGGKHADWGGLSPWPPLSPALLNAEFKMKENCHSTCKACRNTNA